MNERFDLPPLGNLDAKAEAAHFLAGIEAVVDGRIERVLVEEFDGDITEVTPENAAKIVNRRFNQDAIGNFYGDQGEPHIIRGEN